MLEPVTSNNWRQGIDLPSRLFGNSRFDSGDYELYEEDGQFVLSIDVPGYEPDDISLAWDDGLLNVAAERVDESRGQKKTYHRRFRFPKEVDYESITAEYTNGVLEVTLPISEGVEVRGHEIPVES
jgi:HSP20 family protein